AAMTSPLAQSFFSSVIRSASNSKWSSITPENSSRQAYPSRAERPGAALPRHLACPAAFHFRVKVGHAFSSFYRLAHRSGLAKNLSVPYLCHRCAPMAWHLPFNTRKERNDDDPIADHYRPCQVFDRSNLPRSLKTLARVPSF